MRRTQIQLPDSLYDRLKKMARSQETSLSELLRRAAEYLLATKPDAVVSRSEWRAPDPVDLGNIRAEESEWRIMANLPGEEGTHAQR
jgi:hypothetical protein